MCARTSVHTRFRPRMLRSAFSFSSLPSPRSFLPPFSLLPRAPPSIDLAHREPSPPILYTSSIFLRTLPFISCSSLPLAKSSLFFDHLYTASIRQPPPEACLFSLSSPSSRFTGLSRTLSLRCCRLPIFRARETGRYSPLCARSFTMLPRLEPRHRRGRLRGVHSPLEPLHGFVACFAICNACARAAN